MDNQLILWKYHIFSPTALCLFLYWLYVFLPIWKSCNCGGLELTPVYCSHNGSYVELKIWANNWIENIHICILMCFTTFRCLWIDVLVRLLGLFNVWFTGFLWKLSVDTEVVEQVLWSLIDDKVDYCSSKILPPCLKSSSYQVQSLNRSGSYTQCFEKTWNHLPVWENKNKLL